MASDREAPPKNWKPALKLLAFIIALTAAIALAAALANMLIYPEL